MNFSKATVTKHSSTGGVDKRSTKQHRALEIDPTKQWSPGSSKRSNPEEMERSSNSGSEIAGHLQARVNLDIDLEPLNMDRNSCVKGKTRELCKITGAAEVIW